MNVLNLNYANMVKEAQEELNKIWVPNIGDLAINEIGMLGVLINNDKQEVQVIELDGVPRKVYIGVTLIHNGRPWNSENPIWMPRLDQLAGLLPYEDPQGYLAGFNRWRFSEDANYVYKFVAIEELAFAHYMDKAHNKSWNFEEKKWKALT